MKLCDSVDTIKGIGETRTKKLQKLNIFTVSDLLEHFPRDYDDRSKVLPFGELEVGKVNTFSGTVVSKPELFSAGRFKIVKAKISDGSSFMYCVWFNQPYLKNTIKLKGEYIFTGKVIEKANNLQAESPEFEIKDDRELLSNGRIVPVYHATSGLSQKIFRSVIKQVLEEIQNQAEEDFIPEKIRKNFKLCERDFAVYNIHFPENDESFFLARRRLVFEELFLLQVKLLQLKGFIKKRPSGVFIENTDTTAVREILPFKLTEAQEKVFIDIEKDFLSKSAMNRLIQGDVGCGKTAVAMIAAYIAANNGYQTALMAPTDVLAVQHYNSFKEIFDKIGVRCVLLSGGLRVREKRTVYDLISTGAAKIIIGTHAVIQDAVKYNNLGLVITDEQHRFGVGQRNKLAEKGDSPHILVMTATPIPRTLALILYGDLDISVIDKLPPGRQKVDTSAVNSSYYARIYKFIAKQIEEGRQAYVICPMIEENEKIEVKAVEQYTEKLSTEIFPDYAVECIHGKMKNDFKQEIMARFVSGETNILVSTTVIEVGVNIPNASVMLIENAERFGLSQLHQLRGRVGRGAEKSYCILVSDSKNSVSRQRLNVMVNSTDGFEISEKDLELRGPGDFFGTRQHGIPDFKIANLYKDIDILKEVYSAAVELYKNDPELQKEENRPLSLAVEKFFGNTTVL